MEHITRELLQLSYLVLYLIGLLVDFVSTSSNLLQIWAQDGEELLDDGVCLGQVLQDEDHVPRLIENLFLGLEVPFLDSLLLFDFPLGVSELRLPLLEHLNSLVDQLDGIVGILGLEDLGDIDLSLDLCADLRGNTGENLLKLGLLSVDVARDGPDQLKASEKGW